MSDTAPDTALAEPPEAPTAEAPPVDAPETLSETLSEVAEPPETLPEVTETPETPETPAPEDPYSEFGGRETIEAAHRLYEATRTEQGVIDLFIEAGKSLGLSLQQMQALFGATEETPEETVDPDEPLTIGQFQELQRKQAEEAAAREAEKVRETARRAVTKTVAALGLKPGDPVTQTILQLADQHVGNNYGDFDAVAKAVRQGHADFQAIVEQEKQKALTTKHALAQTVPQAPAGGAPAADPGEPEPRDVAEAIKQVRKKLGLAR